MRPKGRAKRQISASPPKIKDAIRRPLFLVQYRANCGDFLGEEIGVCRFVRFKHSCNNLSLILDTTQYLVVKYSRIPQFNVSINIY